MLAVQIVMLNLLIAIMSDSYDKVRENSVLECAYEKARPSPSAHPAPSSSAHLALLPAASPCPCPLPVREGAAAARARSDVAQGRLVAHAPPHAR